MPNLISPIDFFPSGQLGLLPMLGATVPPAAVHSSAVVGADALLPDRSGCAGLIGSAGSADAGGGGGSDGSAGAASTGGSAVAGGSAGWAGWGAGSVGLAASVGAGDAGATGSAAGSPAGGSAPRLSCLPQPSAPASPAHSAVIESNLRARLVKMRVVVVMGIGPVVTRRPLTPQQEPACTAFTRRRER